MEFARLVPELIVSDISRSLDFYTGPLTSELNTTYPAMPYSALDHPCVTPEDAD